MTSRTQLEKFVSGEYMSDDLHAAMEEEGSRLGTVRDIVALRGLLACRRGLPVESVSRFMDWRSFERFCSSLLVASGFETRENLVFTKPRVQLDVVAFDPSVFLSIDCKHWASSGGPAMLGRVALNQIERSRRIREKFAVGKRPVVSAIVTMTEQPVRFAAGAAVVPVHTLRDFAAGVLSHLDNLTAV